MFKTKFLEFIKNRRSIRAFKQKSVSDEDIEKILAAALWAPSGSNAHPLRFVIVKDQDTVEMLKSFSPGWLGHSPVGIVICVDQKEALERGGELGKDIMSLIDVGCATENMLLMAHKLGLGACPIRGFSPEGVREVLELPEELDPELIISLGLPNESPEPPPRPTLKDVTYLNEHGNDFFKLEEQGNV